MLTVFDSVHSIFRHPGEVIEDLNWGFRMANCCPGTKLCPTPVFVNKVLLKSPSIYPLSFSLWQSGIETEAIQLEKPKVLAVCCLLTSLDKDLRLFPSLEGEIQFIREHC